MGDIQQVDGPPRPVRIAAVLWYAAAVLGLAGQFVTLPGTPGGGFNPVALVLLGFMVTLASPMRAGRNWARIVLTVLGLLQLSLTGYALPAARAIIATGPLGALAVALLVTFLALLAAAVGTMYGPGTGAWFAGRSATGRR